MSAAANASSRSGSPCASKALTTAGWASRISARSEFPRRSHGLTASRWIRPSWKSASGSSQDVRKRLAFLEEVGLDYLTLDRTSGTLSGGEAQRIRLATQLGAGLSGVIYVLDEPSIGLHAADTGRLIGALTRLRDLGNTVVVVEHDEAIIRAADHVIDLGPGAGAAGGLVLAAGAPDEIDSPTGEWLRSRRNRSLRPCKRVAELPARQAFRGRLAGASAARANTTCKTSMSPFR